MWSFKDNHLRKLKILEFIKLDLSKLNISLNYHVGVLKNYLFF